MSRTRRSFGQLRRLPSGRYQAAYTGTDGVRHAAPVTFGSKIDAEEWLALRQAELVRGEMPTAVRLSATERRAAKAKASLTVRAYAETWLANRTVRPRTRKHYRDLLDRHILPAFGDDTLDAVTPAQVRAWHSTLAPGTPTLRSHAYALLKSIYATAVTDEVLAANPCRIRGAGTTKRVKKMKPATLEELAIIGESIPARYRVMVLLASWCALRFGELTELRRKDIDIKAGVIHVRRGVVHPDGVCVIGPPKSAAGVRDVAIPPHLLPMISAHLLEHTASGREGLLFPPAGGGCHLLPSSLYKVFYPARDAASRPDLRFHDLRHTGAVLAASTGATLAELMARLGHSTVGAAMMYQHAASDRDRLIAEAMSNLIVPTNATVASLVSKRKKKVAR